MICLYDISKNLEKKNISSGPFGCIQKKTDDSVVISEVAKGRFKYEYLISMHIFRKNAKKLIFQYLNVFKYLEMYSFGYLPKHLKACLIFCIRISDYLGIIIS